MPFLGPRHHARRRLLPISLLAGGLILGLASVPSQAMPDPDSGAATSSAVAGSSTAIGGTVYRNSGESAREAYNRVSNTYGGQLGAVRVFFPNLPASWSKLESSYGATPLVVSFKGNPADIIAGRHDAFFRSWFADAPTNRVTRWSYWHEPEDDMAGASTAATNYKRAWQHLARLADGVGNSRLQATLILMCWTLESNSGRGWTNYYPGATTIDGFGFDCYNGGHRNNNYRSAASLLQHAADLSRSTGKPWGIAELGSVVIQGDNGSGRAQWLKDAVTYARNNGASFVTYFDSKVNVDYRLHDTPSKTMWRSLVASQFS